MAWPGSVSNGYEPALPGLPVFIRVVIPAFEFASPDDSFSGQWAPGFGDDRALSFLVVIIIEKHDHPVVGTLQFMGERGIGIQQREVPFIMVGVQYR